MSRRDYQHWSPAWRQYLPGSIWADVHCFVERAAQHLSGMGLYNPSERTSADVASHGFALLRGETALSCTKGDAQLQALYDLFKALSCMHAHAH